MTTRDRLMASVLIPLCAPPSATAQTMKPTAPAAAAAEQQAAPDGDDIVVTARRREESLSKVPIAIAAIGGQQIVSRSIQSESDLQSAVPGLTVRQNGNANQFNYSIRGQSVDTYTNSPPGVLPYVNEAQIVSHSATAFYDLAGIQVLKGPQGTLFGRNTTGGAVLYQTGQVADTAGGYVSGRYGSFDAWHAEGAVNLPFGAGNGGVRVAGSLTGGGAFVHNLLTDRWLGNLQQQSARGTLKLVPAAGLTNTTVVQYTHDGGTNTPSEAYSSYACGSSYKGRPLYTLASCYYRPGSPPFDAYVAAHRNIFPGGIDAYVAVQRRLGPWKSNVNTPPLHRATGFFAINTTTWDIAPTLTLKNIFSYNRSKSEDTYDYDGTPYNFSQTRGTPTADATSATDAKGFFFDTRQISDEVQLQGRSDDARLNYVVGFYYLDQHDTPDSFYSGFGFEPLVPAIQIRFRQLSTDESIAGFAQATYKLDDRLSATAGIRYSRDRQTALQLPGSVFGAGYERSSASKPSWTASLDYRATPDLLLYATTRGSWRTGGFNYSVPPINQTAALGGNRFDPETTRDVELGAKYAGDGLGIPVTFNIDVYNQWVSDIQRAAYVVGVGGVATVLTVNVPRAEITGVEADLSIRPARGVQIGGSVGYTDARYTDGNLVVQGSQQTYGPFADTPRWTGNAFAELSHVLAGDAGTLRLRGDVYVQSKMYFSNVAGTVAPGTTIDPYALVNVRLAWADLLGTRLTASAFARNLLNRRYYAGGNAMGPSAGLNTANPGQPRMIGGELRIDF